MVAKKLAPPGRVRTKRVRSRIQSSNYYTWLTERMVVRGQAFTLYTKQGMPHAESTDIASILLAEYVDINPSDQVLDLNCGSGLVGALATSIAETGSVMMADGNVLCVEATRKMLEANSIINATVVPSTGIRNVDALVPIDVVTIRLPKGKQVAHRLIRDAFSALKPGGRLYLAGANNEGIKTYLRYVEQVFGNSAVLAYRKGHRVGVAIKSTHSAERLLTGKDNPSESEWFQQFSFELNDQHYPVWSCPGIFSWDRIDLGTRALIDAMQIRATDHVLDLGCGCGIVGVVAATQALQGVVHMTDSQVDAVESAKRTVDANELTNCHVHLSDCAAVVKVLDQTLSSFDVVATNPPFHQGKSTQYNVAHQFIQDAFDVLKPTGKFYLVANRFIPYENRLREIFRDVEVVHQDNKFKVLLAQKGE